MIQAVSKQQMAPFTPEIILGDAAKSISAAAKQIPTAIRTTCWAHVIRNIDTKLFSVNPAELRRKMRSDILDLQLCANMEDFMLGGNLLTEGWKRLEVDEGTNFANYFEEQWLYSSEAMWFEGISAFPSTNNGLERCNRTVEDAHTLRNRLPLHTFLKTAEDMVSAWSNDPNMSSFTIQHTISLSDYTKAYQYKKSNPIVSKISTVESQITFAILPSNLAKISI